MGRVATRQTPFWDHRGSTSTAIRTPVVAPSMITRRASETGSADLHLINSWNTGEPSVLVTSTGPSTRTLTGSTAERVDPATASACGPSTETFTSSTNGGYMS